MGVTRVPLVPKPERDHWLGHGASSSVDYRTFFRLTLASGLVTRDDLPVIRRACADVGNTLSDSERMSFLATYLVQRGFLTRWQCSKLKAGRYKGFFVGKYKLLDCLQSSKSTLQWQYLAQNTEGGNLVEISITRTGNTFRYLITQDGVFVEDAFVQSDGSEGHNPVDGNEWEIEHAPTLPRGDLHDGVAEQRSTFVIEP